MQPDPLCGCDWCLDAGTNPLTTTTKEPLTLDRAVGESIIADLAYLLQQSVIDAEERA